MAKLTTNTLPGKPRNRRRTVVADGPHPIDIYVGSRVRLQRIMRGMTQTDLARLVGISFQSVQKYERGENRVSASRLHEFAQALGVSEQFFFEGIAASNEALQGIPAHLSVSASEGKEFHRQLAAVMSIEDKRLRGLIVQLLRILSELGGAAVESEDAAEASPNAQ